MAKKRYIHSLILTHLFFMFILLPPNPQNALSRMLGQGVKPLSATDLPFPERRGNNSDNVITVL